MIGGDVEPGHVVQLRTSSISTRPDTVLESDQVQAEDARRGRASRSRQPLFAKYQDPNLTEKPEELMKRGGAHYSTAAFHLVDAIENDLNARQVVCCRNNGAIPTFDDDVAVEVSALIGKDGAKAIPQEKPAPIIRGLMQEVKAYESMTVEAAVTGDRNIAYQALLLNPLMPNAVECEAVLNDVLETNKQFLQGTFF
jgi:6-phospho-beta-glucosidase